MNYADRSVHLFLAYFNFFGVASDFYGISKMNQTHEFHTDSFKYLLLDYLNPHRLALRNFPLFFKTNTSLLALLSQIKRWNIERISSKNVSGLSLDLTLDDVNMLRNMIRVAIDSSYIKRPEVIYDQLVFFSIGAIQIQSQTGSEEAWGLVDKFIQRALKQQNEKQLFSVLVIVTIFVAFLGTTILSNTKIKYDQPLPALAAETSRGAVDPVSVSLLQRAYNKIEIGICRSPQMETLPEEQKQALLEFVNSGVVELRHVENLRLALDYINCLYPQEYLHPEGSTGNRL